MSAAVIAPPVDAPPPPPPPPPPPLPPAVQGRAVLSAELYDTVCRRLPGNVCETPDYCQLSRDLGYDEGRATRDGAKTGGVAGVVVF